MNDIDSKTREEAEQKWSQNAALYMEQFDKVKENLSRDFLKKYDKYKGFHDFDLKSILVGQDKNSLPKVSIIVTSNNETFELAYKEVSKIDIQYADENNTLAFRKGFDTIGYDEFSKINDQILSHEILLSSGATILVHFKRITVSKI